jgi:hypothetical protein
MPIMLGWNTQVSQFWFAFDALTIGTNILLIGVSFGNFHGVLDNIKRSTSLPYMLQV